LEGIKLAEVNVYVDVWCPKCGESDKVEIVDYSEMTWFCYCKRCKKRFETMRD
jgi:transcription elongation factor Elf1